MPHLGMQNGRISLIAGSSAPREHGTHRRLDLVGRGEVGALELASDQILVNAIAPGPILAPPGTTADEHNAVETSTPLGRWGGELEIVKAVAFLLESDFVTGETLRIDGGRHLR